MFKVNSFYRVTRSIDNRLADNLFLAENDVVLITRCVKNTEFSNDIEIRFNVDLMFDNDYYKCILWDKSLSYLLEEII